MKQTLLSLLLTLLPLAASADAVEIGGIYYNIVPKAKAAEVTGNHNKYSGSIAIPEKVEYEGTEYSVTSIGEYAFYECSDLTKITIPISVTRIGDQAFSGCSGLTSMSIPQFVNNIGDNAFEGCSGLTSVHITDLEAWCNITFSDNPLRYAHHLYLNDFEITDLVIPNSIINIHNFTFSGCTGLKSITIPNSVISIGNSAFSGCI